MERANDDTYLRLIADGGGLKGLHGAVPDEFTQTTACGGFCASCGLLANKFREVNGLPAPTPLPVIPEQQLMTRLRTATVVGP